MKNNDIDPDCFKGNAGDIETNGHTIFVPLKTAQVEDICEKNDSILPVDEENNLSDIAYLKKGLRILVSDGGGINDHIQVTDRDATDGMAKFILPDGCYQVYARPQGKPGGCMDIDTLICFDWDEFIEDYIQVDCRENLDNERYTLVGHLNVDRSKGKPKWQNATDDLLNEATGVGIGEPGYYDFLWQLFNANLRLLQLRIYEIGCGI